MIVRLFFLFPLHPGIEKNIEASEPNNTNMKHNTLSFYPYEYNQQELYENKRLYASKVEAHPTKLMLLRCRQHHQRRIKTNTSNSQAEAYHKQQRRKKHSMRQSESSKTPQFQTNAICNYKILYLYKQHAHSFSWN